MKNILVFVILFISSLTAASSDSVDIASRNKEIILQCNDRRNRGDLKGAASCFAENLTHQGQAVTREHLLKVLEDIFTAFPDYHHEIQDLVASGDIVIERSIVSGTHKGIARMRHNGGMLVNVPPTTRHFQIQHIHWWRLRDGLVIEHYAARDDLGLMQQLGLVAQSTESVEKKNTTQQP
jgi:predicted ester cyclase